MKKKQVMFLCQCNNPFIKYCWCTKQSKHLSWLKFNRLKTRIRYNQTIVVFNRKRLYCAISIFIYQLEWK